MDDTQSKNLDSAGEIRSDLPQYAAVWRRALGGGCDLFILMLVIGLVQRSTPSIVHGLANIGVTLIYYGSLLSLNSRTLGQRIFGQLVLTEQHKRLSASIAIKRAVWIVISYLLLGAPFLMMLFTKKRQALHDIATNTVVIVSR